VTGTGTIQPGAALPLDFFTTPLSRELAPSEQIRGGQEDPATAAARRSATPASLQPLEDIRYGRGTPLLLTTPGDVTFKRPPRRDGGEEMPAEFQVPQTPDGAGAPGMRRQAEEDTPPDLIIPDNPDPQPRPPTAEESDAYFATWEAELSPMDGDQPPLAAPAEEAPNWSAAPLALALGVVWSIGLDRPRASRQRTPAWPWPGNRKSA